MNNKLPKIVEDKFNEHDLCSYDCELCQELKAKGVKMQWFPDNLGQKKIVS